MSQEQEKTMSNKYDLIVIGSGPAGQKAAIQAAKINKKVAIVERDQMIGGVAVHTGTLPSKTMREAVLYLSGYDQRGLYGMDYRLKDELTMEELMQRVTITIRHETEVMSHQLRRNGVNIIHGEASFIDAHTVRVVSHKGKVSECVADHIRGSCLLQALSFHRRTFVTSALAQFKYRTQDTTIAGQYAFRFS